MRIIVVGADGVMGGCLAGMISRRGDLSLAAAVDPRGRDMYGSVNEYGGPADCLIDFSCHTSTQEVCDYVSKRRIPAVIACTGHTAAERAEIVSASEFAPIFFSSNLSRGACLVERLTREVSEFFPDADVEIVETHRPGKLDTPSGTAISLSAAVADARGKEVRGIRSLRVNGTVGRHEVVFSSRGETLTVCHEVHDRTLFAEGAIAAARFIIGRKAGLYTMRDLVYED